MIRELVSTLRRRLPAHWNQRARSAALGWGWLTAALRPTPEIIVVGAQRAGSTTLFRLLSSHPELRRPTIDKGTGYFDDHYHRGPRWYRAHFAMRLPLTRRRASFECSGYYLFHPLAAGRIAHDLPHAQVVVLVRDPVARAHSAHRHELARGFETLPFAEAVAAEPVRTAGLARALAEDPTRTSFTHRHHSYLARGEYAGQVRRLVEALGPARVHVVDADELFADPVPVYVDLQRRLGLTVHRPAEVGRWNERPGAPLSEELTAELRRHFEAHDEELAALIGRSPRWRKEALR